ncbi:MAG: MATE family efflux transporter [Oscillospiraceae bacterium]
MAKNFRKDLTTGSVTKNLIRFATPFLFSNLLQALYSVVDMIVVGQFCGKSGITGVSIGGQVNLLITGAANGLAISGTVLIAQYIGAKMEKDEKKTIGTMFTLYFALGAIITVIMLILANPLLHLLKTPQSAFPETIAYLNICITGTIFMFGYNAIGAILRGMGDSKRPLYFVMIATVVNIVLDLVLVGIFHMGAAGAAYATIFAQGVSFVLSILYLARSGFFKGYRLKDFKPDKEKTKLLFKIGFPSAIQSLVVSFSFMTLTALVNSLPNAEIASACQGIGGKINSFAILPGLAMSSAISSMAGQNIGAGEFKRAKKTMLVGMGIAFGVSTLMFIAVELFPEYILRIFTDDAQIIATGIPFMRFIAFDYLFVTVVFSVNGLAIGAGQTAFALFNAVFNAIIIRIPLAYFAVYGLSMGFNGVGVGIGFASIFSIIICTIYVKSNKWQKTKINLAKQ